MGFLSVVGPQQRRTVDSVGDGSVQEMHRVFPMARATRGIGGWGVGMGVGGERETRVYHFSLLASDDRIQSSLSAHIVPQPRGALPL